MINNLLENKEPRNVLRQAWQICDDYYKLTKKTDKEDGKLEEYRENNSKLKKQIEIMQDRTKELRRNINSSLNVLKNMDNDLIEMISIASDDILSNKFKINNQIKEWLNDNLEYKNNENKITSTEIWSKFKKCNKELVIENNLAADIFKEIIIGILDSKTFVEKSKKGAIEFIGFIWKDDMEIDIDKDLNENNVNDKKVKPKNKSKEIKIEPYFDKIKDNKLLFEYQDPLNDIMNLSEEHEVRPWQIVSLLIRYKIITKRDEAKGYDKYKQTEEYKQKINK